MDIASASPEASAAVYKAREEIYFDDGREEQLLEHVRERCGSRGGHLTPSEILGFIDEFGCSQKFMMNVGAAKGHIVASLITEHKPEVMIELGGYVGYSTILFASALRQSGGKRYISFEREPKFAAISRSLVELAGLADIVEYVIGSSSKNLAIEYHAGRLPRIDMMFLDHYKPAYVRDVKICESLGMIQPGTVLAADNVIAPGNPPYLEYVRSTPAEKRQKLSQQQAKHSEQFPEKTVHQYKRDYEADDTELPGIPDIMYESRIVHSQEPTGEPDGVEVTICKSVPTK